MRREFPSSDEMAPIPLVRRPMASANSLRPVGVDVSDVAERRPSGLDLEARRERLQRIVVGALAACGLILIAAAGAQVARASSSAASAQPVMNLKQASAPDPAPAPPAPVEATPPAAAPPAAAPAADTPTTGTLRLRWPALPGHVWLDGEKVTASSASVACGSHELRIGAKGHPKTVTVPCGGELRVSR
jgi:hypothetical protein